MLAEGFGGKIHEIKMFWKKVAKPVDGRPCASVEYRLDITGEGYRLVAMQNDLGKDNVRRLVIRLAIPSMMAQFVNVLYSIVDRMYIGNIEGIGEMALAGVGVCGPIVTLIVSFASLIGIGGAPLLAIRLGEKNMQGARQILSNCFILLLGLSGILTAVFLALKGPMLWWFGASAKTFGYANEYLTIYCMGTMFAILASLG